MTSTLGWTAWAAANTVTGTALSGHAMAAGLGPAGTAAVTVALAAISARSLLDLSAVYGPLTAAATPALATGLGVLSGGHSTAPAAASFALFVLGQSARKGVRS
jgi:hypothetical protein